MQKIKKFSDISQFTRDGNWECDFDVEDKLISEGVVSSDILYRHYSADDL